MELWARLQHLELTWAGVLFALGTAVAVLFLRRLLPEGRRNRGRLSTALLFCGPALHFIATGFRLVGATNVSANLHLLNIVCFALGAVGAAGMIVFDIALGRTNVPPIVRDITLAAAFVGALFGVLRSGGVNPLSIVTTSAVATATIGLASQSLMSNVVAGVALQLERNFLPGDIIQVGTRTGRLLEINWRSTLIATKEGNVISVPNGQLLAADVINFSRPARSVRTVIRVAFHIRHSPEEVRAALLNAARDVEGVSADPPPACEPVEFGASSLTYALKYWVDDIAREGSAEAEVRSRIWYASRRASLAWPPHEDTGASGEARAGGEARTSGGETHTGGGASRAQAEAGPSGEGPSPRDEAFAKTYLFGRLNDVERATLSRSARLCVYGPGERIVRQGEPGDSMFLLVQGQVAVEVNEGPARRELAKLAPGDCFGEMSLLRGEPRRATCRALGEAHCFAIASRDMRRLLAERPELAEGFSALLAERQKALEAAGEPSRPKGEGEGDRSASLLSAIRAYFNL